ncbi:hypothetical protein E2C01_100674 [Portunus trituberculatus]|jgi:hypothetical protein
MGSL